MANYTSALENGAPNDFAAEDKRSRGTSLTQGLDNFSSALTTTEKVTDAVKAVANPLEQVKVSENTVPRYTPPVDGGDGYSGAGASIGALFGPEGAIIGAGAGAGLDLALDIYNASENRKKKRAARDKIDMDNLRNDLYAKKQNRIVNKRNEETHALNMESSELTLQQNKEAAAQLKLDKFRAMTMRWYEKQNPKYNLNRSF